MGPRVRVAALDAVHSRRRSTVVVGPLTLPGHGELDTRMAEMTAAGPAARLSLVPSTAGTRWSQIGESTAPRVYSVAPEADPVDLLHTVRALDDRGVTVAVAGDWLAVDFSHGLGELPLIHTLLDVLFGRTDATAAATWRRYRRTRSPLAVAAAAAFGANPLRLAELLADQRNRRRPPRTRHELPVVPFVPAPATRVVGLDTDRVDALRVRRDAVLPEVSMVAVFTCALRAAFTTVGIPVDDTVKIPFDVRRYLPAGRDTLASFSAGLDFVVDAAGDPTRLQSAMTRATRTGRPVANLLVGTMKARAGHTVDGVTMVPEKPALQVLHSNLGSAQRNGPWPFTGVQPPCMLVASDPATPAGVTVTSVGVAGNLWFTAEFHRSVYDPDLIGAALDLLPQAAETVLAG